MSCTFIPPNSPKELDEDAYKAYLLNGGLKAFSRSGVVKMPELKKLLTEQFDKRAEERQGGPERQKSYLNRIIESDKVSEITKQKFAELGVKYKSASAEEAYTIAKDVVAALGVDDAVLLAQAGHFDSDINSAIFGAALNGLYEEQNALVQQNKNDEAYELAVKAKDIADAYDNWLRDAGRAINMVKFVYKQSGLTAVLRQNESIMKAFEDRVESVNKKVLKELLDELNGEELQQFLNEATKKAAAQRRPSEKTLKRPEFRKKVDKFFEDLKIGNKGTTNSFIIPPQIWDAAMEIMKQAILLGDSAIEAVEKAIAYINEKYGKPWDAKDFREKFTPMMASLTSEEMPDSHWAKFVERLKPKDPKTASKEAKSDIEKINDWLSRANNEERNQLHEKVVSWLNDRQILTDEQAAEVLNDPENLIEVLEGLDDSTQAELTNHLAQNIQEIKKAKAVEATLSRLKNMVQKQIDSLNEQIANKQRAPKQQKNSPTDDELEALRAERDDLQRILDDLVPKPSQNGRQLTYQEKIARAIEAKQKAINRLQNMIDKKELRKEKGEKVTNDEIERLDEILKQKRKEHAEMTKSILESMYPDERPDWYKEKILNRYRNRLKRMTEEQKEELIRRSLVAIVTNGGLNYQEFRDLIAEVMGYGRMTPAQQKQIEEYVNTINNVDRLWNKLRQEQTQEALEEYEKGLQEADKAKVALGEAMYTRSNWLATFASLMSLNTLGLVSLVMNASYNLWEQLLVRFPKSLIGTTFAYTAYAVTLAANKVFGTNIYTPNINMLATQKGYFKGLARGFGEGWRAAKTGEQLIDYLEDKKYTSPIRPLDSFKKFFGLNYLNIIRGKSDITVSEAFDLFLKSTAGWFGEAISRGLTLFDKPARFAAEGALAEQIAVEELGLKSDIEKRMFLYRPEEIAKSVFIARGMSEDEAAQKAEQIKERIVRAGERAIFVQNNKVNEIIQAGFNAAYKNEKDWHGLERAIKGVGLTLAKSQLLFVKTPSNVLWSVFNLANPPMALAQAVYHAYKAKGKMQKGLVADKEIEDAKNWLNHAVLGLAYKMVIPTILPFVTGGGDDDEKEKERRAREAVERANSLDVKGVLSEVTGVFTDGDKKSKGHFWVDLQWFGSLGSLLTIEKVKRDKLLEAKLKGEEYEGLMAVAKDLTLSAQYALSAGAFQNSIVMLDAFRKGGKVAENWLVNTLNVYANVFEPATFVQLSKAQLGYRYRIADDSFMERVENSVAARSSLYRLITDKYPAARITPWGDESRPMTSGGVKGLLFNLFRIDKAEEDAFGIALFEDYERTQNPQFLPPMPPQEFTIPLSQFESKENKANMPPELKDGLQASYSKKIKLTYEEWDEFQKIVGKLRKQYVSALVNDYAGVGTSIYSQIEDDNAKIAVLKDVYEETLDMGKMILISEKPEIFERSEIVENLSLKNKK